jgi:hypothetical protein
MPLCLGERYGRTSRPKNGRRPRQTTVPSPSPGTPKVRTGDWECSTTESFGPSFPWPTSRARVLDRGRKTGNGIIRFDTIVTQQGGQLWSRTDTTG